MKVGMKSGLSNKGFAKVTGNRVNRGAGYGMEVYTCRVLPLWTWSIREENKRTDWRSSRKWTVQLVHVSYLLTYSLYCRSRVLYCPCHTSLSGVRGQLVLRLVQLGSRWLSAVRRIEVLAKWRLLCTCTNGIVCPCIGVVRLIVGVRCLEVPLYIARIHPGLAASR